MEFIEEIKVLNPDVICVVAYGKILPKEILEIPKLGCINVHASLLPKLRGGAPIHHAIIDGYSKTGVTIMYMAEGMDDGDIISQKNIAIEEEDTAETLHDKLSIVGKELLLETLPSIIDGSNDRIKQDESLVTFSYNLMPEEEQIDFSKDARSIFNQVRSLLDEPCAYFNFNGYPDATDRVKVLEATVGEELTDKAPGEIVSKTKKYFTMACGNNTTLNIHKVQPFGKKPMNASDFINGGLRKYWKE